MADNFHITVREASSILKKLEMAGFASVMLHKSEHMRGRPTKIYHINLGDLKIFLRSMPFVAVICVITASFYASEKSMGKVDYILK